jgi:hypothetical protein
MSKKSLQIQGLSDRHVGVTPAVASSYYEAACVCLDRHHTSPQELAVIDNDTADGAVILWQPSDQRAMQLKPGHTASLLPAPKKRVV